MDLFEQIEKTRHFGEAFLTWLLYRSDVNDAHFLLEGNQSLNLNFDNELTLEANVAEAEKTRLSGGNPALTEEAREGLRQGKVIVSAKLKIEKDQLEWLFTLNAKNFTITGLKIPSLLTKADDEKLYERQYLIEQVDGLIRGLYLNFLKIRLEPNAWEKEFKEIQTWISTKVN